MVTVTHPRRRVAVIVEDASSVELVLVRLGGAVVQRNAAAFRRPMAPVAAKREADQLLNLWKEIVQDGLSYCSKIPSAVLEVVVAQWLSARLIIKRLWDRILFLSTSIHLSVVYS